MPESHVQFQPMGRKIRAKKGSTLLELAREGGVPLESICNSAGKCGKCRVVVRSGGSALSEPSTSEQRLLTPQEIGSGKRLACQARVLYPGSIVLEVPEESLRGHHRLLAVGLERKVRLRPAVRKIVLRIPPATMKDLSSDDERLIRALRRKVRHRLEISPGVHKDLPRALRACSWVSTVALFRGSEVIKVEPGDTTDRLYGVAVDIGTTKVVAYLVDLNSGETVRTESSPNPQIPYGEDVMSRITYADKVPDGLAQLQKAITATLNSMIAKLCEAEAITPDDVLEVMVVGNTAMHHIFFGIPVSHLADAPYAPAVRSALTVSPAHVGLGTCPSGKVSSLPNIAGFVGADAVADLLASGLYEDKKTGMMIDIGTNTEIIAGNRERLVSCSCASGPAFEGAHIKFGMRASTGAIERVWIDPATKEVTVRTVEDSEPRGICGSGIVDALAEMLKVGILDTSGKIIVSPENPGTRRGRDGLPEFVLVRASESAQKEDIVVTQHDVQEIQLAKAAIFAGVAILMKRLGLRCSSINRIYAAGAFGTYVDASSAISIGMYPDVPVERIKFIGNAAGSGARMCLRSTEMRDLAESLSKKVEYIELAAQKEFQAEFAQAMFLPHRDMSRFSSIARRESSGR